MPLWTEWWVWMSGALILATLEVLIPGYIFLGFAIGAGVMGLLILVGVSRVGTGDNTGDLCCLVADCLSGDAQVFRAEDRAGQSLGH